jgi:hypothetical protein
MALSIPLEYGLIAFLLELIVLPILTLFGVWALSPFWWAQTSASLFKHDLLITDDGQKMHYEVGQKKHKNDSLYRTKKGLFGPVKYTKLDPTKWDRGNGSRFGSTTVRYFYPGKMWPKPLPAMLASENCLVVASLPVTEEMTKNDPTAIIKHNKYLCLIAKSNPKKALTLLRSEKREEIEQYANQFFVLPEGVDENDQEKIRDMKKDLADEVTWVREYMTQMPVEVNLSAMMKAYPDRETCDELMAKVDAENLAEARATSNVDMTKILLIVAGIVVLAFLAIIVIIAIK